jgi:sporulation protein YlmC with PRC-barrel domain
MMSGLTEFTIGSEVSSSDGPCGELRRVVIDPVARVLTHLVVEPKHGRAKGHLVPINLVVSTTDGVVLACTTAEFEKLEEAEETQFISGGSGQSGYEQDQMLSWPYYGRSGSAFGMGGSGMMRGAERPVVVTNDRVPLGEVEVRRGEHVLATDGEIGRVRGLVIHPDDHGVTHVLLDEGHLWGQKRVAIPISAVTDVAAGVRLNLTKDQVRDLPPVEVDEHV